MWKSFDSSVPQLFPQAITCGKTLYFFYIVIILNDFWETLVEVYFWERLVMLMRSLN